MTSYTFTVGWFTPVMENFKELLSDFSGQEDLRFLEIGSFEGRASVWMLENILTAKNSKLQSVEISVVPALRKNLEKFGDKVEIFEGVVSDFYKINKEKYDFIYVDGSHISPDVLLDAVFSFEMLKVGGIMLFDDYLLEDTKDSAHNIEKHYIFKNTADPIIFPRQAIDSFVEIYKEQCVVLDIPNNYQLAIGKTFQSFADKNMKIKYDENGNRIVSRVEPFSIHYRNVKEVQAGDPERQYLKRAFKNYPRSIKPYSRIVQGTLLDLAKIRNKNFTIISDDGWGEEVYKALNLQALTPCIGIQIYNADFIELASNLKFYTNKSLKFIQVSESKHIRNFEHSFGNPYPIALLDDKVELHFTAYSSEQHAEEKWYEGLKKINWNNLFIKIDVSREGKISDTITGFEKIRRLYANTACFLDSLQWRDIVNHPLKNSVTSIDNWNSESRLLFPISLSSFNVIDWLNKGQGNYTVDKPFSHDIFDPHKKKQDHYYIRFDDHYFIKFDRNNVNLLDSYFPNAITIGFDEDQEIALINYAKSGLEHFRLSVRGYLTSKDTLDLFVDLTCRENRHVFILAKGDKNHVLRVDFVAQEDDSAEHIHLNVQGFEQEIPNEFEWMHFDLSSVEEGEDVKHLFEKIKSFCFYINPGEDAEGVLEIMAVYIGQKVNFEKFINEANPIL